MSVRILSERDVRALLPMNECIEVMTAVFRTLARGEAVLPLRTGLLIPDGKGRLGLMPAWLGSPESVGIKVITVMPGNHGTAFDSHQGAILLFETEHGSLRAVIDASSVTAIRTGAASGVATRLLARGEAGDLALIGSGIQAASHLEAMLAVRRIRRVRVYSRTHSRAQAFAARESKRHGLRVEAVATARAAIEGADLVCATTSSREPVLLGEWLADGAHVNAAGACFSTSRELDSTAVVRSRLFVDRMESALAEAGDILMPLREGIIREDHIVGEIGDVLEGRLEGRRSGSEITLFKSLGIAVEDLAAAHHIHAKAVTTGTGIDVDFGGGREP